MAGTVDVGLLAFRTQVKAPANFAATALTSSSIALTWDAPGGFRVAQYEVERSANGSTGWTQIYASTATSTTSGGLSPLTAYYYRARTLDAQGNYSPYTSTVSATTLSDTADDPGNPIFFDDFAYTVDRVMSASSKRTAYSNGGGWSWCKDNNDSVGARGYIFNVDSIVGYAGTIPGASGRALCIESASAVQQGDLYLQVGDNSIGSIPAPIWIQWWQYVNRSGAEMSSFSGGKFIYPLASGSQTFFPAPTVDTGFLGGYVTSFFDANKQSVAAPQTGALAWVAESFPISGDTLANAPTQDRRSDCHALRSDLYNRMGPHSVSGNDCWLLPNTWYLNKMRIDTTGSQGIHEVWRRAKGTMTWTKTHEWNGASTSGFDWNTHSPDPLGWRVIRIPVTLRGDFWMYLADFALALTEDDLPTYGSY